MNYYKLLQEIIALATAEDEYQILCANCNWIKRHENKENRKNWLYNL